MSIDWRLEYALLRPQPIDSRGEEPIELFVARFDTFRLETDTRKSLENRFGRA